MVETQRMFLLFIAPLVMGTVLLLPVALPARAAEIPSGMKIDFSSIAVSKDELICLALNDYFEARSESLAGRIAVAKVVLNRAMDRRFPPNLCDVVKENHMQDVLHRCQFSWYCDERADTPYEKNEWRTSLKIATAVLQVDAAIPDHTGGALWYHADFTRPFWSAGYETTTIIGHHIFYREPDDNRASSSPVRKPFIYRLNAFAEYVDNQGIRKPKVYASADSDDLTETVKTSAIPAKP